MPIGSRVISLILLFSFTTAASVVAIDNSILALNVDEDSWYSKASMVHERERLGVVASDGKIYAIGGCKPPLRNGTFDFNGSLSDVNEQYDPWTNTWITLESMPTPRSNFAIVAYQNKIYCIGGAVGTVSSSVYWWVTSYINSGANEVYDIDTDSWSTKAAMPVIGRDLKAHVIDGQIFVISGSDLYCYNPNTDSWTAKTSMPLSPRDVNTCASAVIDGKIMVMGEFSYETSRVVVNGDFVQKFWIYNPKTNVWSEKSQKDLPKVFGGVDTGVTTGMYAPVKVYVFAVEVIVEWGGYITLASNQVYDPLSNTWSTGKDVPKAINGGVVVVDDILYVIGGQSNEQYLPIGYHGAPPPASKPFLIAPIAATIIIAIGFIFVGLHMFQKRKLVG